MVITIVLNDILIIIVLNGILIIVVLNDIYIFTGKNQLLSLNLIELKEVNLRVDGVPFAWFENLIYKTLIEVFKNAVKNIVTNNMKKVVSDIFNQTNTN